VDFVPDGNAHGRVIEAAQEQEIDMAELTPEQMEEITKRVAESVAKGLPEIITAHMKANDDAKAAEEEKRQQEAAEAAKPDDEKALEQRVAEAVAAKTADAEKRIQEQADQLKALQDAQAAALTLSAVTTQVQARDDLSPVSQARVIEGFAGQIIAPDQIGTRVQEACDRERTYALELLQAAGVRTRVTGSGSTDTNRTQEATKAYEDGFTEFARNMGVDAKTLKAMQELPQ
jgi:hypothetical protein